MPSLATMSLVGRLTLYSLGKPFGGLKPPEGFLFLCGQRLGGKFSLVKI
jgi:hypothetical protein